MDETTKKQACAHTVLIPLNPFNDVVHFYLNAWNVHLSQLDHPIFICRHTVVGMESNAACRKYVEMANSHELISVTVKRA